MQWQVESLEAEQQRERERLLQWGEESKSRYPDLELPAFDSPALTQESDRRVAWQHQQALKLQAAVQHLYGEVTPPNLWKGDKLAAWEGTPENLARLRELQTEYPSRQREQQWMLRPIDETVALGEINELIIDSSLLSQLLCPYWERLGGLELYLIAYPVPIERFISPDILILSPSLEPRSQQQFEERIIQVVDRFISSNLEC
ncbi:hypothetical protein [Leptolyngbya sp. NIES-2104]|uniref:hypothetical protein n=1 Tax=Leptolyngbya sp. NIES-2104 TaxID=1552121 RepID=UPI0006ECBF8A|nr:hypothetical protein [Leptolyngbya sp. NIES-2104]GAP99853.1 hypothetical protein NIES2104_64190 [Leptolyngbya sp. NIES-2104]